MADCENGLNSVECLRNEINKLRMDLRPITNHLPANTKHYMPFGSLESDWNRLLQLESMLPEDHHLRQQLTKSFLLLVQAVREALEYQVSKTTTVQNHNENSSTITPEGKPELEIDKYQGNEGDINNKNSSKIILHDFEHKQDYLKNNADKAIIETIILKSEEIDSNEKEEPEFALKKLQTINESDEENSESIGDFDLVKAEGLVGEDFHISEEHDPGKNISEGKFNQDYSKQVDDNINLSKKRESYEIQKDEEFLENEDEEEEVGGIHHDNRSNLHEDIDDQGNDDVWKAREDHNENHHDPDLKRLEYKTQKNDKQENVKKNYYKETTEVHDVDESLEDGNGKKGMEVEDQDPIDIHRSNEIFDKYILDQLNNDNLVINTTVIPTSATTTIDSDNATLRSSEEIVQPKDEVIAEDVNATNPAVPSTTEYISEMMDINFPRIVQDDVIEITPENESEYEESDTKELKTTTETLNKTEEISAEEKSIDMPIDDKIRDIIYPASESTTTYVPPPIDTGKSTESAEIEPINELQAEEHIPHTLENVDVFGGDSKHATEEDELSGYLPSIPSKVARHTTHNHFREDEYHTEPLNKYFEFYTESPILEFQSDAEGLTRMMHNMGNVNYFTELPYHHISSYTEQNYPQGSFENLEKTQDSYSSETTNPYTDEYERITNPHTYTNSDLMDSGEASSTLQHKGLDMDPGIEHASKWNMLKSNKLKHKFLNKYGSDFGNLDVENAPSQTFAMNEEELEEIGSVEDIAPHTEVYDHLSTLLYNPHFANTYFVSTEIEPTTLHPQVAPEPEIKYFKKWNLLKPKQKLSKFLDDELKPTKFNFKSLHKYDKYANKYEDNLPETIVKNSYEDLEEENAFDQVDADENVQYYPSDFEKAVSNEEDYIETNHDNQENYEANVEHPDENEYISSKESGEDLPHNDESSKKLPFPLPTLPAHNKPKITAETIEALNRIIFGKAYDPNKGNKYKLPELGVPKPTPILLKPLEHHR